MFIAGKMLDIIKKKTGTGGAVTGTGGAVTGTGGTVTGTGGAVCKGATPLVEQ
jgi:hypothetical protein